MFLVIDSFNDAGPVANDNEMARTSIKYKGKRKKQGKPWTTDELRVHAETKARDFHLLLEFAVRHYDAVVWCYCDSDLVFGELQEAHHYLCGQRKNVISEHFHSRVMVHEASGFLLSLDEVDGNVRGTGAWHRGCRCPAKWALQMTFFINTVAVIALTDQFPV